MTNPSNAGQAASRMVALADALAPLPRERLKKLGHELGLDPISKAPLGVSAISGRPR